MVPVVIKNKLDTVAYSLRQEHPQAVHDELSVLGLPIDSEIGELLSRYYMPLVSGAPSELIDIVSPNPEIRRSTKFIQEVWELPSRYLCISSTEGEGAFLYDKETGAVLNFNLGERDLLLQEKTPEQWPTFFDFLEWYLAHEPG